MRVVVDVEPWHDGPFFARFEFFEAGFKNAAGWADERAYFRWQIPSGANAKAFHGIAEGTTKAGVVVDLAFKD
jgi:hypothetical protein